MTGAPATTESFDLLRMDREIQRRQTGRRLTKVAGWTGLLALALARGRTLGWIVAAGAVYGLVGELADWRDERPEWKKGPQAGAGGLMGRLLTVRRPADPSEHSFPASDPPSIEPH